MADALGSGSRLVLLVSIISATFLTTTSRPSSVKTTIGLQPTPVSNAISLHDAKSTR